MKPEYRAIEIKMGNGEVFYNLQTKEYFFFRPSWSTVCYRDQRPIVFETKADYERHIRACENDRLRTVEVSRTIIDIKGE